ncbi:hypothetical protein PV08_09128 [Exophiala spinifera]|uniref:Arginase n=1 Tax=Exophiala spinifera TaxID=91928 RepID=A0A0D2AZH5_9EURO|nr:uncharacterized protein PV08_09128 [Exophiala spinifera]KIW11855.1 hypothetical protein PV08_09128 [Exophiala spinifera]
MASLAARASRLPLSLIGLPYQFGRRAAPTDYQMARGPEVLLAPSAVPAALKEMSTDIDLVFLDDLDDPKTGPNDVRPVLLGDQMIRQLHQNNALAAAVRAARSNGRFPVCFSGCCNSSLGIVGGIDDPNLGMVWFDAHADDYTPETSPTGFFDGMPVSIIAGECWKRWREKIQGFHVIPPQRISQVGLHDRSAYAESPGRRAGVGHLVDPAAVLLFGFEGAFLRTLDQIKARTDRVYVHVDTDVIDAKIMRANLYCAEGGVTPEQMIWAVEQIAKTVRIEALNFASFDAAVDPNAPAILTKMIQGIVGVIQRSRAS